MATNNKLLYNAAIAGCIASLSDRWLTAVNTGTPPAIGTPDPSYAALAAFGTSLATATDADVPTDSTGSEQPAGSYAISVAGGTAKVPEPGPITGDVIQAEIGKSRLLEAIVLGIYDGRYASLPIAATSAELASLASAATAAYLATVPGMQGGGGTLPAAHNDLLWNAAVAGFIGAVYSGRSTPVSTSSSDAFYEAIALNAASFGEAFDSLITNDSDISQGGGLAAVPSTSAIMTHQLGKTRLAMSVVIGPMVNRMPDIQNGVSEGEWLTTALPTGAAACAAMYKAAVGGISVSTTGTPLNDILYNEAYCGFIAGLLDGRPIESASSTDPFYVALAAAAAAFASEVDAAVGAGDIGGAPVPSGTVAITTGVETSTGTAIIPSTGIIVEAELGKASCMWEICRATMKGRQLVNTSGVAGAPDNVAATYATIAKSVVALYLEMTTVLICT